MEISARPESRHRGPLPQIALAALALAALLVATACSDSASISDPTDGLGGVGEPCYPDNICDEGLSCISGVCTAGVSPPTLTFDAATPATDAGTPVGDSGTDPTVDAAPVQDAALAQDAAAPVQDAEVVVTPICGNDTPLNGDCTATLAATDPCVTAATWQEEGQECECKEVTNIQGNDCTHPTDKCATEAKFLPTDAGDACPCTVVSTTDGTGCNDGEECTDPDTWQSTTTGCECVGTNVANNTECSDDDNCTWDDKCVDGACVGAWKWLDLAEATTGGDTPAPFDGLWSLEVSSWNPSSPTTTTEPIHRVRVEMTRKATEWTGSIIGGDLTRRDVTPRASAYCHAYWGPVLANPNLGGWGSFAVYAGASGGDCVCATDFAGEASKDNTIQAFTSCQRTFDWYGQSRLCGAYVATDLASSAEKAIDLKTSTNKEFVVEARHLDPLDPSDDVGLVGSVICKLKVAYCKP